MASGKKTKNNHKTVAIKDITEIIRALVHAQSCLTLTTPQTVAGQAPPSMGFSRQEYWSGFPPPQDLPSSDGSPALAGGFVTTRATWEKKETGTQTRTCSPRFIAALLRESKGRSSPNAHQWMSG